jgi:DNA primase
MRQSDQVRAAADIVRVIGDYVKLRKNGANFVGLCPFHHEKTPSFAVHPTKQIFHCFGCGVGGDVFKFVMLIDGVTFPEALERLAERAGIRLRERPADDAENREGRDRSALLKIHEIAAKFFESQLGGTTEGRAARAYLLDRGLDDEVIARFRLGFAPSGGQALWRQLKDGGFGAEILEKSGLILRNVEQQRHYDRFRRRVMFPIANESGKVVAFGGRALGDEQPKYLNSPETAIYTKSRLLYNLDRAARAIRETDEAVLVEGYIDSIAVTSAGVDRVVASCGTSLTESQVRLLARFTHRIIVNYDPDAAGVAATERSLGLLLEEGFEVKVLALPSGLDPDAFVRKQGAAAYRAQLGAAVSYVDYVTDRAITRHDVSRPEGRVAAANSVLPYVAKIPDPLLRSQRAQGLALRLQLDEAVMRDELKRAAVRREAEFRPVAESSSKHHGLKQLLRACLENEDIANEFVVDLVESGDCVGLPGENIFRQLYKLQQSREPLDPAILEQSLPPDDCILMNESLFWPGEAVSVEVARGLRKALGLQRARLENERLQTELQRAVRENDTARLAELQSEKYRLANKLLRRLEPRKKTGAA